MVCVVGWMRDLILQLSKSSIYSTKPLLRITFTHAETELSVLFHKINNITPMTNPTITIST
ncbi:hypothetical protein C4Y62_014795 [Klebsiella pneumoniae subsp. pneumoniae]|nr:hypothetical protein C4Y62_014795 [Klebsiella pneumoniae subsp. pneumoniae]